jgi:uncharacterized protein YndB with AHSA1/START domain
MYLIERGIHNMSNLAAYKLERLFDASRDEVWHAWTDPELLCRWYGPNVETIIPEYDLKPGGLWLTEMIWNGYSMRSKVVFTEIKVKEKMVWNHFASTDANWNPQPNPQMPSWPRVLLTTVTFEEDGSKTRLVMTWEPFEATEIEQASFAAAAHIMIKGWESGFDAMDILLSESTQ